MLLFSVIKKFFVYFLLSFFPTFRVLPFSPPPKLLMKVVIKEWNAVATWKWNTPDDEVCGICRVQFDGTCPTCKFPGDDCPLSKLQIRARNN